MNISKRKINFYMRKNNSLCLNCGKAITPEVLKSRFCLMCNMEHRDQIRTLIKLDKVIQNISGGILYYDL